MKRHIFSLSIIILLLCPIVMSHSTHASADEKEDTEIELSKAESEIVDILKEIENNNTEVFKLERALKLNAEAMDDNKEQINKLNEEIDDLKKTIEKRNKILLERVAAYQETGGDIGYLEVLLGAKNFSDFLSRVQAVYTITKSDIELIEANKKDKAKLEESITHLEQRNSDLKGQHETIKVQKELLVDNQTALQAQEDEFSKRVSKLKTKSEAFAQAEETIRENIENNKEAIESGQSLANEEETNSEVASTTKTNDESQASKSEDNNQETVASNDKPEKQEQAQTESSSNNQASNNASNNNDQAKTESKPKADPKPKPDPKPEPKPDPKPKSKPEPKPEPKPDPKPETPSVNTSGSVTSIGNQFIGNTVYVWGSNTPSSGGFDCSGFVQWAYQNANGRSLPRTTFDQVNAGSRVDYSNAQAGDLVFFDTAGANTHVGIYLGGGQFIGSQNSTGVAVANMNSGYWKDVFNGIVVRVN